MADRQARIRAEGCGDPDQAGAASAGDGTGVQAVRDRAREQEVLEEAEGLPGAV